MKSVGTIAIALIFLGLLSIAGCKSKTESTPVSGPTPPALPSCDVGTGNAADTHVLIVGNDAVAGFAFTESFLSPFGFAALDSIDYSVAQPTLSQFTGYDAVLFFAWAAPSDRAALGDVLADYVDAGCGLVIAVAGNSATIGPLGGITAAGYSPFNFDGSIDTNVVNLGTIALPAHPIMQNVTTLITASRNDPTLAAGGVLIASWDDALPLAAVNAAGTVAALNVSPVDDTNTAGDFDDLIANALLFTTTN